MDRNTSRLLYMTYQIASLSARRAWIEITIVAAFQRTTGVALRKESVDRNTHFSDAKR